MKTCLLTGIFFILTSVVVAQAKISFEATTIDYDDVSKGHSVTQTIAFKNVGDQPLTIDKVETTSHHLEISKPNKSVAPGKTGKIVVTFDTKVEGPIRRTVTVYSNASNSPVIPIKVKGCVISD